jgi:hypothetical protein
MPIYTIQTPTGQKLDIEAADEQSALRGAQQWHAQNGSSPQSQPVAKPSRAPDYDFSGARQAGYSDDEILNHVSPKFSSVFDIAGAQKAGYSPTEIVDQLAKRHTQQTQSADTRNAGSPDAETLDYLSQGKPLADAPSVLSGGLQPAKPPNTPTSLTDKAQALWDNPTKQVPGQVSLPVIGRPSIVGAIKSLLGMAQSGATAPGDALAGKLDPSSDEAIKRAANLAMTASLINGAPVTGRLATVAPPAVTNDALRAAADAGYNAVRSSPVELKPSALQRFAFETQQKLEEAGLGARLAPGTHAILGDMAAAPAGATITAKNLEAIRQTLGNAAKQASSNEARAANTALSDFKGYYGALPMKDVARGTAEEVQALGKAWRDANANYAALKRAEMLEGKVETADLNAAASRSGLTSGEAIRSQVKNVLNSERLQKGFSEAERARMDKIVSGGSFANLLNEVGSLAAGGGGHLGVLTSGAASSFATGGVHGFAIPLAGLGLKKISSEAQARAMSDLLRAVRMRSALGAASQPTVRVMQGRAFGPAEITAALTAARVPPLGQGVQR